MKGIFTHIKKNSTLYFYATLAVASFFVLFSLLCMRILQSDDYSYAQYFKGGFLEFLRLTREHYLNLNGRAFVHIAAQISLSLPRVISALTDSSAVLFTAFFAFKFSHSNGEKHTLFRFLFTFIALIFTLSPSILKESVMWTSGFYNYVFPALVIFSALFLLKIKSPLLYPFCFFSGATTEQWGFVFIVMLFVLLSGNLPKVKHKYLTHFLPVIVALFGYGTIFLSPATFLRVDEHSHMTVSASLIDLPRLSEAFLSNYNSIVFLLFFLVIMIVTVVVEKGEKLLFSGLLPAFLLISLPFHTSYAITFTLILLYILMCGIIYYLKGELFDSILLIGAVSSAVIMIPTNTFDERIVFPFMCLLMLFISNRLMHIPFKKAYFRPLLCILLVLVSTVSFIPSQKGFYKNYLVEKENLLSIRTAQKTGELNYNIDYDKNFAMRQMFNDGWFFTEFLSLYNLENCNITLTSKDSAPVFYKGENLGITALVRDGQSYIPMRKFLEKTGGTIEGEEKVVMTLEGKTLTLEKGMFVYSDGYAVAQENRLPDFYTLYIKESLIKKAFGY